MRAKKSRPSGIIVSMDERIKHMKRMHLLTERFRRSVPDLNVEELRELAGLLRDYDKRTGRYNSGLVTEVECYELGLTLEKALQSRNRKEPLLRRTDLDRVRSLVETYLDSIPAPKILQELDQLPLLAGNP